MKAYLPLIALLSVIICSFEASARDVTPAAVPKNLHVYSTTGSTYVDHVSQGCSRSRYYLSPNHVKYDAIFSILLAAQLSERKVKLFFSDCVNGSNPQGNIVGVQLESD